MSKGEEEQDEEEILPDIVIRPHEDDLDQEASLFAHRFLTDAALTPMTSPQAVSTASTAGK